ncbi:MAG: hypothetical protein Q7J25_13685 [Vicinamibacterales bacterium]|nr:hypothetical protein [Vicinamibacterales bacterium]
MRNHPPFFLSLLTLALTAAACGGNSTTSPASTSVASPTATETFTGQLAVGGSRFYSFVVPLNGTVNVTLVSVGGTDVVPTVMLVLGIGTPSGTGCATSSSVNAQAGVSTPQITLTEGPGRYCAVVADIGNLVAPATFTVTIDHP